MKKLTWTPTIVIHNDDANDGDCDITKGNYHFHFVFN